MPGQSQRVLAKIRRYVGTIVSVLSEINLNYLLGSLYRRSLDLEAAALDRLGVGVKQQAVLSVLADEGAMTQQRLGQRLGIDRTTIVGLVDALVERGLVERVRDPVDRRAYLLTRTRAGGSRGSGESGWFGTWSGSCWPGWTGGSGRR